MEEKERYIVGKGENISIVDNDQKVIFNITTEKLQDLLNRRDKRIKELEKENKKANINNYLADYWLAEKKNQQLKQSQKQLAIEELRKVQSQLARNDRLQCLNYIVNRIKELGGKENE